ncbi:phosphoserine aminotransferase [Moesziomyces antarcticus]|uniref:Phosphoserine aminotransferase n=2 Tax=Pseudozyma antarctica TaxID=84753 RepID=A0A081CM30_PSEA2|nr:phosphoserine aminotransferase [Moesziomyces antarcticus]GAK67726.1 phosphoserine aminotransferase [Moesziomyces antarcticus]SPO49042.1 uncharacterized protein PSANT_06733 [Moesziomyces antarcticus]
MSKPSISLTHAFTMTLTVGAPHALPGTPVGDRSFIPVTGGTVEGEGVEAKVTPNGGDFAIVRDGYGKLDVRVHAITQDGEALYIQYYGHLEVTSAVAKILGGDASAQSTNFDDQYLLTTPVIEAPATSKLAWVNRTVFVGKGRFEISSDGLAVVYEVFKAK